MKFSLVYIVTGILVLFNTTSVAQDNTSALIPMPNSITKCDNGKAFKVNEKTKIISDLPQDSFIKEEVKDIFAKRMGVELVEEASHFKHNRIELAIDSTLEGKEHYTLKVDKNGISIKGATTGAVYWGVKTLDQLLIGDVCNTVAQQIEYVCIDDNPRYGYRAIMIDPAYELDPGYGLPAEEQAHIEGVMATLWAEAIRDINRLTYMTYPRGMAIAEAGWSDIEHRNWESFKQRIYPNIVDLMKSGVSVRVPFEIIKR